MAAAAMTMTATWPHDLWALRLSEAAASNVDGFHRSWIMLFREGKFPHQEYGEVDLSRRTLDEIKANFDGGARGIEIALDEEHDAKKATGWIEQLEYRPAVAGQAAGLWAYVRWTPYGLQMLREQVYRYISPEFRREWRNPISGQTFKNVLVGGALTNRPFLQMDAIQLSTRRSGSVVAAGKVEGSRRMATKNGKAGMKRGRPADDEAEDEALAEEEALDEEEEYAEGEMPEDEEYDEGDGDGPDADPDADEEETRPAPKKRSRKRAAAAASGSKKMSERAHDHDGETLALREQLRLQERQLSELREREQALSLKLYERAVDEQISAWGGEQAAPSKALGDAYRGFMLSEGLRLSEATREAVRTLVELAFKSAVDLSQNAASFDMETRVTKASDGDKVVETANRLALSDARNTGKKDMMSLASGTSEERALAREMLSRALKETGAQIGKLQLVSK